MQMAYDGGSREETETEKKKGNNRETKRMEEEN